MERQILDGPAPQARPPALASSAVPFAGPHIAPSVAPHAAPSAVEKAVGKAAIRPRSPQSPVAVLVLCAATVALLDLASKQIAAGVLGARGDVSVPLVGHVVRLTVVLNDQSAFGVSLGPYTWHINIMLTLVALVLSVSLCRALSAIDAWSPIMLGLIAGAATGNLVSLIVSPQGVPDFIAVRSTGGHELVFNLADVAAMLGVLLLIRTTWAVAAAIRRGGGISVI